MDGRGESNFLEYFVCMFLPETWRFGVTLHSGEYRNHVTIWDRVALKMLDPSFVEGPVWFDKERLFRWWRFRKCVGDISTEHEEVFCGGNGIEQTSASLLDAVGIRFGKDKYFAGTCGAVTNTAGFLPSVNSLDVVCPDEMKNGIALISRDGVTEHALCVVLVELEKLRVLLPIRPISLLKESPASELHSFGDTV